MEVLHQNVEKHFGNKRLDKRLTNRFNQPVYITFKNNDKTRIYLDLLVADEFDVNELPTKKNCTLFRFTTPTTLAGGMAPAIMINIPKSLIYFFDEEKNDWENRGYKADLWAENWNMDIINQKG
jgi:hypothetical protein